MSIDISTISSELVGKNPDYEFSDAEKVQIILLKKILNQLNKIEEHTRPINPL